MKGLLCAGGALLSLGCNAGSGTYGLFAHSKGTQDEILGHLRTFSAPRCQRGSLMVVFHIHYRAFETMLPGRDVHAKRSPIHHRLTRVGQDQVPRIFRISVAAEMKEQPLWRR